MNSKRSITVSIELNEEGTEIVSITSNSPNKEATKMKEEFVRDMIEFGCKKHNMTVREYLTSELFISDNQ